ncbi:hypothetical protein [Cellulomonas sp. HD19AZ1]|uniref:hypothetical protein n=1 Tax=Cellulomonas sp. HD19AZ1 TaxID=2559593 RepID=UPI001070897F|nr:hypothetical protein [Cellulomonas sp. HD19AZ1]TFH70526.1 hypothetical protein E4A51_12150 [Cellulomonas sp. HD19AZ1]
MAEPVRPLLVVAGEPAGMCDPEAGACALPARPDEPSGADAPSGPGASAGGERPVGVNPPA